AMADKITNLKSLGFRGSLAFVHNEEGSGARAYNCSIYYPDNPKDIKTNSGVTLDPGLDLGQADRNIINEVLQYYCNEGYTGSNAIARIKKAVGKKREGAVEWMRDNIHLFKGWFKIEDEHALYVLDKYTAPAYWLPLV